TQAQDDGSDQHPPEDAPADRQASRRQCRGHVLAKKVDPKPRQDSATCKPRRARKKRFGRALRGDDAGDGCGEKNAEQESGTQGGSQIAGPAPAAIDRQTDTGTRRPGQQPGQHIAQTHGLLRTCRTTTRPRLKMMSPTKRMPSPLMTRVFSS